MSTWLLESFNRWFTSGGGVWHTLLITVGVVVLEVTNPHVDPHGFWLLYWMTIYSAVTQPALAHAGAVSAAHTEELLSRIAALEESILALVRQDEVE